MARPIPTFHRFCGQQKIVTALRDQCAGALQKNIPLPHILLGGSSGFGKSHLARAIAEEMGTACHSLMASRQTTKVHLVQLLSKIKKSDIVFIDEAHALSVDGQELLYLAIDNHRIPKIDTEKHRLIEADPVEIAPFTLIVASDQHGRLRNALVRRMVHRFTLTDYTPDEMRVIVRNRAAEIGVLLTPQAATAVAAASRGIPRCARHRLDALRVSVTDLQAEVTATMVRHHLAMLGIDADGLTADDRRYLQALHSRGTPVSLQNLSQMIGLDPAALVRDIEPWLIQSSLVGIGPGGRFLTQAGKKLVADRRLA